MSIENLSSEFQAISDTNHGVWPMKMALGLIFFCSQEEEELHYGINVTKTKMLISCLVTAHLISQMRKAGFLMPRLK